MENKKILVCSIPSWNSKTGSDTFSSIFSGYDKDKLANLYIRGDIPDSEVCQNYFHISENAVIKSILKRNIKTGEYISTENTFKGPDDNIALVSNMYKKSSRKRNYFLLLAREILWKIGHWKSTELNTFLDEFNPDVVLFAMEGSVYFNRVNRYILKYTGAKGIGYFWDDNFTYRQSNALGHTVYRFFQRHDLKKTAKLCKDFFAITKKTKKEADDFFDIDCKILTKPIDFEKPLLVEPKITSTPALPLKMLYTGKLIIGRFDTVRLIGEALDEINKFELKIELDVYTTTVLQEKQIKSLSPYVHILGAIPQTEIPRVQQEADLLLFAEALNGENANIARLSFSTKLTDYFRSGKCIFAVGNMDTAPMEYLKDEDAALLSANKEEIVQTLTMLTDNLSLVDCYSEKAYNCGKKNHDIKVIQETLFQTLNK